MPNEFTLVWKDLIAALITSEWELFIYDRVVVPWCCVSMFKHHFTTGFIYTVNFDFESYSESYDHTVSKF